MTSFTLYRVFRMFSPVAALLSLNFGCLSGAIPAPSSARIKVAGDYTVGWSSSYNEQHDQLGMVLQGYLMVYDSGDDNMPLEAIEVEMISGYPGVYLIPAEAVKLVGYPEASVDPTDQAAIRDACTDANGNFKSDPEWCAWYWDTESQQFYEISGQYVATDSNYAPNYMVGQTNGRGLLEFYIYVDALPVFGNEAASSFGTVTITTSIGVDTSTFEIRAADI